MSRRASVVGDGELHLARCRRRRESAWVLAARIESSDPVRSDSLATCFRITDSVFVRRLHRGFELHCVFDDQDLVRSGVERRLRELVPSGSVGFGWAQFPNDGLTLATLVERARESLPAIEPATPRQRRHLFRGSRAAEVEAK